MLLSLQVFAFENQNDVYWVFKFISLRTRLCCVLYMPYFGLGPVYKEVRVPGGYSIYPLVGRCGRAPHTLTLFKTNIADFPTLFKTEFRFLIPCLRHLTRILINKSL